jgi:hypothetical protein
VRLLKILLALPVVALMIGFAKMTQFAAVDAFGGQLGTTFASLLGAGPVLALYYWAAIKLPKLNTYGLSRG